MEQNINHPTANVINVNQSTQCEWIQINVLDLDPHGAYNRLKVGSQDTSLSMRSLWLWPS